ncbi:MAG TPA: hypothetical protein VLA09_11005, partial [Longimicrobiales bacterium]|nr:hypothetical protein [Longimicrobiales bacterium]
TVRLRLGARRGGPSDADWAIHRAAAALWEGDDPSEARWRAREVSTDGSPEEAVALALGHLGEAGLAS